MLDTIAPAPSIESLPALSHDMPIVFDNLPVTEYSQYPSDFLDDDFDNDNLDFKSDTAPWDENDLERAMITSGSF